jgi:hypothetical protein
MDDETESMMRRLIDRADAATANPAVVLFGTFQGSSRTSAVTVWVDAIGRLERVEIAQNSAAGGNEASVAAALMEAYGAARANAENLVLEASSGWQAETPQPSTRGRRNPPPEDDDNDGFTILRRY